MKYALFTGCKIPSMLKHYGTGAKGVLKHLGTDTVELKFNCCGYPVRDIDHDSFLHASARNIAIAEKEGLDIITPCKCCFGAFKHADYELKNNPAATDRINSLLKDEELEWTGRTSIIHLLTHLDSIGADSIKKHVVKPLTGMKVAAHYGCHALRPSDITGFDNPQAPDIFERIIRAAGAETVDWPRRLECCGNPVLPKNKNLSLAMMNEKTADAAESGADCIATACTYCQIQFDQVRYITQGDSGSQIPSLLVTQLLGMAMGLSGRKTGIKKNNYSFNSIKKIGDLQ